MLDWKEDGVVLEDPAITFHIDTTAVGTDHDLYQISFLENLLHEMFYVAKGNTKKKINMLVGTNVLTERITDMRVEDIDQAIECLFTFPTKLSKYMPMYEHVFSQFVGDHGHLYASMIPTLVYIVLTFTIPIDYQAFLKRQSKNNTVLTVIIYIKDPDIRYNRSAEIWHKSCKEYRNVRFIALENDCVDEAVRALHC